MIWKALEICTMQSRLDQMKSSRIGCGHGNCPPQLRFEFVTQPLRYCVVTPQRFSHILLYGGVVFDIHRLRRASIRFQNSVSDTG